MKNKLKSLIPALNFLLPIVIYIAASLMAFVFWNHNHYYNPGLVWITNILLCIVGSFLCGFFTFGKSGKIGMIVMNVLAVAAVPLWIFAESIGLKPLPYILTTISGYYFNLTYCDNLPEYLPIVSLILSVILPIIFILLGRFIRVKCFRRK
ncbi:MAG: hypothetical protein HFJ99_00655 [Eubacterium sp.]|jgi:hypothetical protein|nr:hypothetical protein [Eubacterium sp.]